MNLKYKTLAMTLLIALLCPLLHAQDVVPAAILTFNERGSGVKGEGDKVSDILFAELVADPSLYLVDRSELDQTMKEQEMSLSGMVNPAEAVQVGQLTGARILITGSIIEAGNTQYLVAKIIGTETSRVLGSSVKGRMSDPLSELVPDLAKQISATIQERTDDLLPKVRTHADRVTAVSNAVAKLKTPPVLFINIEERHVGQATIDPAAEIEFQLIAGEAGFEVVDNEAKERADIRIIGEAFSEFGMRRGNLVSVKARLEVKALDRDGNILAVDRQTRVAVDLSEHIAGKTALQEAGAELAERLLPKVAETSTN